jgi:hypothetical protein
MGACEVTPCTHAILALLTRSMRTKDMIAALDRHPSAVWSALAVLKRAGCIRRLRRGVWVKTGRPYVRKAQVRREDTAVACAEALGISRQRAYILMQKGLAWKEGDTWVRKHTRAGRPK